MTDPMTPPELVVPTSSLTNTDSLGVLSIMLTEIRATEQRLGKKIDENELARRERWAAHETEHGRLAQKLESVELIVNGHLQLERDEDMRMEARLGPVKRVGLWFVREWRTVLIVTLVIGDVVGQLLGTLR
jgi:hypothetical protein